MISPISNLIYREGYCHVKLVLRYLQILDLRGNLENVKKEKPTRKTCFSCEMKRLALRIYLENFY